MQGWALSAQGHGEQGIAQMHQGLAAIRATGAEIRQPYYLALLAEAYDGMSQPEEGLRMLAEARHVADHTGEHWYTAELYRLTGAVQLRPAARDEQQAEAYFCQAIEISRQQQAKSFELRAAMSLTRLWQHQSKRDEARELLAEIYGWFTEGFDTADLQEAKALLEELA